MMGGWDGKRRSDEGPPLHIASPWKGLGQSGMVCDAMSWFLKIG